MKRFGSILIVVASPLLGAGQCSPTGGIDCDPTAEDCGNLDVQIDGEGDNETFASQSVQMCDAGNGTLYAVWVDDRRELDDVWFSRSDDGGENWLPQPVQVKQGSGDASNPALACNADRVYVAWEDTRDSQVGYTNIYVNFSNDAGDTWRKNDRLIDTFDDDGRQISLGPQVAFRGPNVHVVWFDQNEGAPDIYSATSFDSGNNWEDPIRVSGEKLPPSDGGGLDPELAGETWSGNPRIVLDDDGAVHAVWEDAIFGSLEDAQEVGAQDVLYARTSDNTAQSWSNWVRMSRGVDFGTNFAFGPRVGTSGDNVYVVWSDDRNGAGLDVFALHSADGGTSFEGPPQRLDDDDQPGANQSRYPELVVAGDAAHVVWQDDVNGGYDIYYRRLVAGVPDEDASRLDLGDNPGQSNSLRPRIAMGEGQMTVGWLERRVNSEDGFNELMYNYSPLAEPDWASDDWRLDTVAGGTSFSRDLQLATFGGEVFAAWTDFRQGNDNPDIRFSHTELGSSVLTVDELEAQAAAGAQ